MGKQAKLPDIDFAKVGNALIRAGKDAGKFISDHAPRPCLKNQGRCAKSTK